MKKKPDIRPSMKDVLGGYKGSLGIYPGSFNPFHVGHWDIVLKARRIFKKVIIAQGMNAEKDIALIQELPALIAGDYVLYNGLVTDLFENLPAKVEPFLIRGLRNEYDLGYEESLRKTILDINSTIQFVYLFCDPKYEHVSSSMIRGLMKVSILQAGKYMVCPPEKQDVPF